MEINLSRGRLVVSYRSLIVICATAGALALPAVVGPAGPVGLPMLVVLGAALGLVTGLMFSAIDHLLNCRRPDGVATRRAGLWLGYGLAVVGLAIGFAAWFGGLLEPSLGSTAARAIPAIIGASIALAGCAWDHRWRQRHASTEC